MSTITQGAKDLDAASRDRAGSAALLGVSVATLYRWCNGSAMPPDAQRNKIFEKLGVEPVKWTIYLATGDEAAVPAASVANPAQLGAGDKPSPLELWKAAHAWRLDLQRRASTASAIGAAFKAEQAALVLLAGDAQRYADMQRITAEVLKAWPDALEALQAALAEADL